jgi:hypothetical protein
VDASLQRRHHFTPGANNVWGVTLTGDPAVDDDDGNQLVNDAREAGFGDDVLDQAGGRLLAGQNSQRPLFADEFPEPFFDGGRNPAMLYQPMTRIENLVTTRSNVFAVWITVGYFEVEKAPSFVDVQRKFGGDGTATEANPANNPVNAAALGLYNRVYPEGYMLGREVGSETGDIQRHRGFYIIDRSQEVGFKPGEDLNVEKTILLRRRIE